MCNCNGNPSLIGQRVRHSPARPRSRWGVFDAEGNRLTGWFRQESRANQKLIQMCDGDPECTLIVEAAA